MSIIEHAQSGAGLSKDILANRVTDSIREDILMGVFAPGYKLREVEFSQRFGVSHNVIREAFHVLQGEGLVVSNPHRGRMVRQATEEEARDLLVVRTTLESLAAFWAAERLTPDTAARIGEQTGRIRVSEPKTYVEWVRLELAFHRAIWETAGLPFLEQQLTRTIVPFFSAHFGSCVVPESNVDVWWAKAMQADRQGPYTHQAVSEAILSREPKAAREIMILHLMQLPSFEELRRSVFGI